MKRIIKKAVIPALISVMVLQACTKLDENVYSNYTDANFPTTAAQYAALTGPVYVAAQKFFDNNFYDLQEAGTDELIVPTRGGDWFDGGKWRDMHYHTWTPTHDLVKNAWDWGFNAIGTCNKILTQLQSAPESSNKTLTLAQIRTMRAWYYYNMMDAYGNIPLVTTFDQNAAAPEQATRAVVYNFIASELEEVKGALPSDVTAVTYGMPTKWMAFALLARLYLNAEVYVGTAQWDKAVAACDSVIASGKYLLESDFAAQFKPDNGPQSKEPIFSIPFDAVKAKGNLLFNKTLHYGHQKTFKLTTVPWNGWCGQPAFYHKYEASDKRAGTWLSGQQYDANGAPVVYNGVNVVLDPDYFPAFDVGGADDKGRLAGARNNKYYADANAVSNNANNDFVVYRYADILLMKAEAVLRGAANATRADALDAVNQVRDRAFNNDVTKRFTSGTLTLAALYDERGRELSWEMSRRTDMIRFGKWEDAQLFKAANPGEAYRRIFPIPSTAIASNPKLHQNPNY